MVQIIYPEIGFNLAILAMFFAILSTELMAASALLFKYKESQHKVFRYLIPIWEVTGTFFVFYVVNLEALIPSALPLIAYSFITYILIFLILYVLRNASIIFAEYIWKNRGINRRFLYSTYAVITFILGAMILVIYTAFISGRGMDYSRMTFNFSAFISFIPDDGFIIGSAVLLFGFSSIFYGLDVNRVLPPIVIIAGMAIAGVSFVYLGNLNNPYVLAVPIILTVLVPVLWFYDKTRNVVQNKIVFQGIMAVSVFFLAYSQYPYLLGKSLNLLSLLNNDAMQTQVFYTTLIGGVILLLLSLMYFNVALRKNEKDIVQQIE
ncbi:hypothetical protein ApAK_00460 [Thermoplasmatales archaeon AK]|nr:hypothetical protein [Thermoplasmatales archaeon AK]